MGLLKILGVIAFSVVFTLLSLFVYTKLAGPIPFSVSSTTTQKNEAFSVTGQGKASIKPDKATVRLGVNADGATADIAKNKMNEVINKVTGEIKALGVGEPDIKTENVSVYENNVNRPLPVDAPATEPVKDPNLGAKSYIANTTLVITAKSIEIANQVIDVGTKNGINQVGGVQFDNIDKSAAENEARQKAVEDAKKKAETAAKTAGFTLGKIINYQENNGGYNPPLMYAAGRAEDAKVQNTTQLNPGENEVTMSVTLSYEVH